MKKFVFILVLPVFSYASIIAQTITPEGQINSGVYSTKAISLFK